MVYGSGVGIGGVCLWVYVCYRFYSGQFKTRNIFFWIFRQFFFPTAAINWW